MFSDLAVTALLGACVLLVVAGVMVWAGRRIEVGVLPLGGRLAIRTQAARASAGGLLGANQAAAPFMQRYGTIVAGLAVLVVLLTFVSDVAAVVVHLLAVLILALGLFVCVKKAGGAGHASTTGAGDHDRTTKGV